MHYPSLRALLCLVVLSLTWSGCSSTSSSSKRLAVVAVTMAGGGVPSKAQLAEVHATLQPKLAQMGYTMAANSRNADYIVHVRFTPDPLGSAAGHVAIDSVESTQTQVNPAVAAREEFREQSARAIRQQITEPPRINP